MGGRGGSSGSKGGGGGIAQSKNIYNSMLQQGLNSNIKGIRTKAKTEQVIIALRAQLP